MIPFFKVRSITDWAFENKTSASALVGAACTPFNVDLMRVLTALFRNLALLACRSLFLDDLSVGNVLSPEVVLNRAIFGIERP